MSVTKEFATKIDTELSELYEEAWSLRLTIASSQNDLVWYLKTEERKVQYSSDIATLERKIAVARGKSFPNYARQSELDQIYRSDRWTRAYLVVSSDGHVHKDMYCSTCFDNTRYRWLVQYSNDEETTIVDDAGELACTVCYPSAPAETLNRPTRIVIKEKVEKEIARVERQAKSDAKKAKAKADAPSASGEPLRIQGDGRYYDEFKTERSAISEWYRQTDTVVWKKQEIAKNVDWYGVPLKDSSIKYKNEQIFEAQKTADLIAESLAGKYGITYEEQVENLMKKYEKRNRQR